MHGMDTRFCPQCGSHTHAALCPSDGIATFELAPQNPSSGALQPGDIVAERYRVTALLGQGGHGAVYEAEHLGGLGLVALKVLSPGQTDPTAIRRFYREARVTSGLKHANTVRLFDLGQMPGGALFLVMERLQGITLEEWLRQRWAVGDVVSQNEAIDIALHLLQSLSEAHGQGLIHRDLKPANIMLTQVDGERCVKVLDFGIAWAQDMALTTAGHAVGTPAYMSPEQCSALPLDPRSDLYSLAVLLFRCVVGRPPFVDPQALSLMYAHNHMPPPSLAEVTRTPIGPAFAAVVARGLAKQPADRFDTARLMRAALQAARGEALTILPKVSDTTQDGLPATMPQPVTLESVLVAPDRTNRSAPSPTPAIRHRKTVARGPLIVASASLVLAGAAWALTRNPGPQGRATPGSSAPSRAIEAPPAPVVAARSTPPVAIPAQVVAPPQVVSPPLAPADPPPPVPPAPTQAETAPFRNKRLHRHGHPATHDRPAGSEHGIEATLPGDD